jgi:hypothetical protein
MLKSISLPGIPNHQKHEQFLTLKNLFLHLSPYKSRNRACSDQEQKKPAQPEIFRLYRVCTFKKIYISFIP